MTLTPRRTAGTHNARFGFLTRFGILRRRPSKDLARFDAGTWPFLVTLLLTGYGYLFGLGTYGVAEEGVPDDAGPERRTRSPISS